MTRERIPEGLRERGTRLWKETTDVLDLEAHEELTLLEACRTADRLDALADALEDAPLTVTNARGDEVAQPLMVEARQQSIVLARLIAALRIPDAEDNRPQHRGVRGAYGVQMRSVS